MDTWIYDWSRTPRARSGSKGELAGVPAWELTGAVLNHLKMKNPQMPEHAEELVLGCVHQTGEQGGNLAKTSLLALEWPEHCSGSTVNRYCCSGLAAVQAAASGIHSGMYSCVLAGGTESITSCPMLSDGSPLFQNPDLVNKTGTLPVAAAADLLAHTLGISQSELDDICLRSHAMAAESAPFRHNPEYMTTVHNRFTGKPVKADHGPRTDLGPAVLACLPPLMAGFQHSLPEKARFRYPELETLKPMHTKAHAPGMADGAALLLLGNRKLGDKLRKKPLAKILACTVAASDPVLMLTAPAMAAAKALHKAGLSIADIDLFEINEGFAVSVAAFVQKTGVNPEQVNTWGGAIALGHPLGATGAVLIECLLENLLSRNLRTGLVAIPGAGGSGAACVVRIGDR